MHEETCFVHVQDMRPIGIAEGTEFRAFCQEFEPRYRIPKIPIQVCLVVLVCPPVIDIMRKYKYSYGSMALWCFILERIFERHFGAILTAQLGAQRPLIEHFRSVIYNN